MYNQHRANVRNGLAGLTLSDARLLRDGSIELARSAGSDYARRKCHEDIVRYANEWIREVEADLDGYSSGNDYPLPFTD